MRSAALFASKFLMSTNRIHLAHIDGLRALCAFWVLLYHANGTGRIFPALPFFLGWIAWGHFAVPAFIVISGFCLMLPVVRKGEIAGGARHFYWKRVRRILPPYYAALLLFALLNHVTNKKDIISHILLLHNLRPDTFYGGMNYSFWSIAVECQIYVVFPLFAALYHRWSLRIILPVLLAAYLANAALQNTSLWGLCLHYTGLFALGAAGAVVAFHPGARIAAWRERFPWTAAAAGLALVLLLAAALLGHPPRYAGNDMTWISGLQISAYNLLTALAVVCLLVAATVRDGPLRRALSCRPLVWSGTFSYSLYLLHQPLVNLFAERWVSRHSMTPPAAAPCFLFLIGPAIVAASYVFHRVFERPFMSLSAKPAPDAA